MNTNISKYQKVPISTMPPILTMGILIVIVSFIMIAKGLFHKSNEEALVPTLSGDMVISQDTELDTSEREILTMLTSVVKVPKQTNQGNTIDSVYLNTLQEYLSSSGVYLNITKASQVKDKIIEMQEIIRFEEKTDFSSMSLDGRKVIIYISEQIYELCGLRLVLNMEGVIEKISDRSGNIIYTNIAPARNGDFQVNALVIILSLLVILFSICIIIAKKNQLFIKEVIYDGFDEERFA